MDIKEVATKNKFWIFLSLISILVIIVLSYMIISAPDRNAEINSLKQDKALLEGQIVQIKNNNIILETTNKKLELKTDSLNQSMVDTQKKIDKLNYDLKTALARISHLNNVQLVNFFTDHFNGK